MTQLNVSQGVQAVCIEATATTVSANAGRSSPCVNDFVVNDGVNDVAFTVTHTDGNTQVFTLKSGEINSAPFLFKNIAWVTASGTSSFRMFAHVAPKGS